MARVRGERDAKDLIMGMANWGDTLKTWPRARRQGSALRLRNHPARTRSSYSGTHPSCLEQPSDTVIASSFGPKHYTGRSSDSGVLIRH